MLLRRWKRGELEVPKPQDIEKARKANDRKADRIKKDKAIQDDTVAGGQNDSER